LRSDYCDKHRNIVSLVDRNVIRVIDCVWNGFLVGLVDGIQYDHYVRFPYPQHHPNIDSSNDNLRQGDRLQFQLGHRTCADCPVTYVCHGRY
jgi:hypothetical protein